jgi:tRNA-dependent cyclodipeptide synthase
VIETTERSNGVRDLQSISPDPDIRPGVETAAAYHLQPVLPSAGAHPSTVLLGASPFNPEFTPKRLREHLAWATQKWRVHVLLAGVETSYRLIDAGDEPRAAVRRVIRVTHEMRCAARRGLDESGYSDPDRHIHVWTKLAESARYRELRGIAMRAYQERPAFRKIVQSQLISALQTSFHRDPTQAELEHSAPYILAETPLLVDAPAILGVPDVMFVYHRGVDICHALFDGIVPELRPSPGQGFGIITTPASSTPAQPLCAAA